ncbi:Crp/Fnr family transcriptional regulator [soil metagenome]
MRLSSRRQSRDFMTSDGEKRFGALLRTGRWFGGVDPQFAVRLLAEGVARSFARGQWLFSRGDPSDGLYAMTSGAVRVRASTPSGKETLLALLEPPMWFGEIGVFDRQPRTHDAIAEDEVTVLHVPQAALEAALAASPHYWRDLGQLAVSKLRQAFVAMEAMAVQPLAVRLAGTLVVLAERYGELHDRSSKTIELGQEQLAAMLSSSRQTVNALLRDLESRGLVRVSYGTIEILDKDGLKAIANPT